MSDQKPKKPATIFQAVLPSGRGFRYRAVTTDIFMQAEEKASASVGTGADPGDARRKNARAIQMILLAAVMVTVRELPFVEKPVMDPAKPAKAGKLGRPAKPAEPLLDAATGLPVTIVDVGAMLAEEYVAANGGWRNVSYAELIDDDSEEGDEPTNPFCFRALFGNPAEFGAAVRLIADTMAPERRIGMLEGKAMRVSL